MTRLRARITVLLAVALVAGALPPATTGAQQAGTDLSGTWTFTVNTDNGSGTPTVILKQQGDSLSGTYSSRIFGNLPLRGAVSGKTFRFECTATMDGQSFPLVFTGTVRSATELEGSVGLGGMGSGTFTAKKERQG